MGNVDERNRVPNTYDLAKDIGIPVLTPRELIQHLHSCYQAKRPVLIFGRPGCGKTEIVTGVQSELSLLSYPYGNVLT